ncbi:hypothetical protein ABTM81_20010, partial [Acinetobacter baumannii]
GTTADPATGLDAALVALSGRIRLREGTGRTPEDVIGELWRRVFAEPGPDGRQPAPPPGKAPAPGDHRG